jgi:hypothetical protein
VGAAVGLLVGISVKSIVGGTVGSLVGGAWVGSFVVFGDGVTAGLSVGR